MKKVLVFLAALLIFLAFSVREGLTMPTTLEVNKMKKAKKQNEEEELVDEEE